MRLPPRAHFYGFQGRIDQSGLGFSLSLAFGALELRL
jgi:hypothetical protein